MKDYWEFHFHLQAREPTTFGFQGGGLCQAQAIHGEVLLPSPTQFLEETLGTLGHLGLRVPAYGFKFSKNYVESFLDVRGHCNSFGAPNNCGM